MSGRRNPGVTPGEDVNLESQVALQLSDVGAPEDLAPQLVAIAIEYHVPPGDLLNWIR